MANKDVNTLFVAWLSISCQALSNGQLCEFVMNLSSANATVSFAAACISASSKYKHIINAVHSTSRIGFKSNSTICTNRLPDEIQLLPFDIRCAPVEPFQHFHSMAAIFQCNCRAFLSEVWGAALIHCTKCWTLNLLPIGENDTHLVFSIVENGYCDLHRLQ